MLGQTNGGGGFDEASVLVALVSVVAVVLWLVVVAKVVQIAADVREIRASLQARYGESLPGPPR